MLEQIIAQLTNNDPALTEVDFSSIDFNLSITDPFERVVFFLVGLATALKNNQHLTTLRLTNKYYNFRGENLKNILKVLQTNTCLTELDLNTNDIDGEASKAIAQLLEKNTGLTTLNLKSNLIDDAGISTIITALITNKKTRLTRLNLYDNEIHDAGAQAIANLLKMPHCPTALDLGRNHITGQGARSIAEGLETNTTIQELSLYHNQIKRQGAKAIALAINNNPHIPLRTLNLSCNEISTEGATAFASMLRENSRLEELDLFNNKIGDVGVEAIAKALTENTQSPLSILKLSYNKIGDAGAKAIAEMLMTNKKLTMLDLSANSISDEGIAAITEAAKGHLCLKTLHLGSNKISTQGAKTIASILAENPPLEVLALGSDSSLNRTFDMGQEGLIAIVEALKNNQHLKKLDLSDHKLGDEGAKCIAELLAKNTPLTHINLEHNRIGYEGLKAIAEAMEHNTNLLELDIFYRTLIPEMVAQAQNGKPSLHIGKDPQGPAYLLAIEKCLERNRRLQNPSIVIPEHPDTESEQASKNISLEISFKQELFSKEFLLEFPATLKNNQHVITLNLSSTTPSFFFYDASGVDKNLQAILDVLKAHPSIKKLDLSNNQITAISAEAIAEVLRVNPTLTTLTLEHNFIDVEGAESIAKALNENLNSQLAILELCNNQLKGEGVKAIAQSLWSNKHLTRLDVDFNEIGAEGAGAVADLIKANTSLKELHLSSNHMGDEGVIPIAQALEKNGSAPIATLDLSRNEMGIEGAKSIARMLEINASLTDLGLAGNRIGDEGTIVIANALQKNKNLQALNLNSNQISDEGAIAIAELLKTNPALSTLSLASNALSPNAIITIIKALETNTHLTTLDLSYNKVDIDNEVAEAIVELQKRNPRLIVKLDGVDHAKEFAHKAISSYMVASELPFETFAAKVSDDFTKASALVAKHEDVSVLKEEKSAKFPWGKLALLLLVLGLGGTIGLSVAGLFFWIAIPTVVFLIGVGVGIKALYDTYQQRQRAYQNSLLTADNKPDIFTGQDKDQSLLLQNQLENSYKTREIRAEEASVKLTEILENKGLDFEKARAIIRVQGYYEDEFYLTYESLTDLSENGYGSDEEGKAEFQKGWELVEALVIDNPSQRKLPYENYIVVEVDTILNMGLKNNEGSSVQRKEGQEVPVDDSSLSVTAARNNTTHTFPPINSSKFFPVKISQVNASNLEEVQKAKRAKEIIIQKLNELANSHQTEKLIIKYQNANFEFTPEEIQECFTDMETKLEIVQQQSTGHYILQWETDTSPDKRRELIEKQFHRVKKQAGEVFSSPATMMGTFDMDRRQSVLVKLAITHCIGENIAVKHPDIRHSNSIIILFPSIEKIIRENSEKNEKLTLDV